MNKPIYKKWWFIVIVIVVLLSIISLFIPKEPGSQGREAARRVADSLKKCQSNEELANWYKYVTEQLTQLKDEVEIKAFNEELDKLTPNTNKKENESTYKLKWVVNHFVDQFGESTADAYITTNPLIEGYFSNTATTNSDLQVSFLISDSTDVALKLYEYSGDNPVKAMSVEMYYVYIKDNDGQTYSMMATNYDDRLTFGAKSKDVHNILMKGGTVKFRIVHSEYSTTEYKFDIDNADGYKEAYKKLISEESIRK